MPLDAERQRVHAAISSLGRGFYSHAHDHMFQKNLIAGRSNQWHCRAGARYLYVCEDGLVHWCSQQRGTPGIPLARYGPADLDREYQSEKSCAPHCTVSCVHRVSLLDEIRDGAARDAGRAHELGRIAGEAAAGVREAADLDVRDRPASSDVPPAGVPRVPARAR